MHDVRKCPTCGGQTIITQSSRDKDCMTRSRKCVECKFIFKTHEISNNELNRLYEENTKLQNQSENGSNENSIKWLQEEVRQIDIMLGGRLKAGYKAHIERKRNIYVMCIEALKGE